MRAEPADIDFTLHHRLLLLLNALLLGLSTTALVRAQAPPAVKPSTAQEISARIEALKALESTSNPEVDAVLAAWTNALTAAQERTALVTKRTDFETRIAAAPKELEEARNSLNNAETETFPETPTLEEATAGLTEATAALNEARKAVAELNARQNERRERNEQIPNQMAALSAELDSLPVAAVQPPATASDLEKAQFELSLQQRLALSEQLKTLEAEKNYYRATEELISAKLDLANSKIAQRTKREEGWRGLVNKARNESAGNAIEAAAAQVEAFREIPELRDFALRTKSLAEQRSKMASELTKISREKKIAERELSKIKEDRQNSLRRLRLLESAGVEMMPRAGELLAKEKGILIKTNALEKNLRDGLQNSAEAEIELFELKEAARELSTSREQLIEQLSKHVVQKDSDDEANQKPKPSSREITQKLVNDRRDVLSALEKDYQTYVTTLQETNELITLKRDEASKYHRFLDERLLWLPSLGKLSFNDIEAESKATRNFLATHFHPWLRQLAQQWIVGLFFGLLFLFLLGSRRKFHAEIENGGSAAALRNCTSFIPTLKVLALSLIIAFTFPVLFGGMALIGSHDSMSVGFTYAAFFSGLTGFASVCSRPNGLFESHFRMEKERCQHLHFHLRWFLPVMLPAVFLTGALAYANSEVTNSEDGRLFFLWMMTAIALLAVAILRPSKGFVFHKGKPSPMAKLWLGIALLIPGCLFIGAALGFFTSMLTLRILVVQSFWLLILIWMITRLILRWVLVSRRRLAIEQALRRREAYLAEREKTINRTAAAAGESPSKPQAVQSLEEVKAEAVNVVEVEEQTARLTRAIGATAMAFGLWAIWAPTLPALSVLDSVIVLPDSTPASTTPSTSGTSLTGTSLLTGSSNSTAGDTESDSTGITRSLPELIRPTSGGVSVQDILVGLIMLVLTFVAAKNVPGLLELTLLRRINLEPGGNFAFTTTIRYVIVIVGIILAFGKIGVTWSKVQWIAAAVTLGIGFGLQEIFANFVAGLILLFERPIRLGDVVTIGDASGKVTQIRIRATTILQFNNRELVVPNKELITGTLINWTLSDGVLRIEIPVGIAYGSDTEKAREILLQIASQNDRLLKSPAPDVLFSAFGDSALNFQLRAHVGSIEDMLPAKNELFFAVEHAFKEAGIEIAFPQTDIHIRSMPKDFNATLAKP